MVCGPGQVTRASNLPHKRPIKNCHQVKTARTSGQNSITHTGQMDSPIFWGVNSSTVWERLVKCKDASPIKRYAAHSLWLSILCSYLFHCHLSYTLYFHFSEKVLHGGACSTSMRRIVLPVRTAPLAPMSTQMQADRDCPHSQGREKLTKPRKPHSAFQIKTWHVKLSSLWSKYSMYWTHTGQHGKRCGKWESLSNTGDPPLIGGLTFHGFS